MKPLMIIALLWAFGMSAQERYMKAKLFFDNGTTVEGFGYVEKNEVMFSLDEAGPYESWNEDSVKKVIFFDAYEQLEYEFIKEDAKDEQAKLLKVVEEGAVTLYIETKFDFAKWALTSSGGDISTLDMVPGKIPGTVIFKSTTHSFPLIGNLIKHNKAYPNQKDEPEEDYEKAIVYLKREGDAYATKIDWNYKKQFMTYFRDCTAVTEKFKSGKFGKSNIAEAVLYYNNYCTE